MRLRTEMHEKLIGGLTTCTMVTLVAEEPSDYYNYLDYIRQLAGQLAQII